MALPNHCSYASDDGASDGGAGRVKNCDLEPSLINVGGDSAMSWCVAPANLSFGRHHFDNSELVWARFSASKHFQMRADADTLDWRFRAVLAVGMAICQVYYD